MLQFVDSLTRVMKTTSLRALRSSSNDILGKKKIKATSRGLKNHVNKINSGNPAIERRKSTMKDVVDEMLCAPATGVAFSENVVLTKNSLEENETSKIRELMMLMLADNCSKTTAINPDALYSSQAEYLRRLNEPSRYRNDTKTKQFDKAKKSFKSDRFFYSSVDADSSTLSFSASVSASDSDNAYFTEIDVDDLEIENFFDRLFVATKLESSISPTLADVCKAITSEIQSNLTDRQDGKSKLASGKKKLKVRDNNNFCCSGTGMRDLARRYVNLNKLVQGRLSRITFVPSSHRYYVGNSEMRLSVTKALDLIFGAFDEDLVTSRMINSSGWKRNKLYKRFNYDSNGSQRSESQIKQLILNEWKEKRDRGTVLHDYINRRYTAVTSNDTTPPTAISIASQIASTTSPNKKVQTSSISPKEQKTLGELLCKKKESHATPPKKFTGRKESVISSSDAIDNGVAEKWWWLDDPSKSELPVSPPLLSPALSVLLSSTAPGTEQPAVTSRTHAGQHSPVPTNHELLDVANVEAFDKWNQMVRLNNWILVGSEYSVSYEKAGIAGTLDAIFIPHAENPNQWVIVDWKRCPLEFSRYSPTPYEHPYTRRLPKCNYWKYAFQLNMYREIIERTFPKVTVIDMLIVNFLPEDRLPRYYSVPRLHEARLLLDDLIERHETLVGLEKDEDRLSPVISRTKF